MSAALVFLATNLNSAGIAIILFTIGIKCLLLPLTIQQYRSTRAMQALQPKLKELQAKHKGGDRQKLTEETMALYKEHKVNPAAGCLPVLLQMPILLGMYGALRNLGDPSHAQHSELFSQGFLWLTGHFI